MNIETLQEIVCQAHMVGQHSQSGVDPSWSEAFAYWKNEVEPKLTSDNSDYAKCGCGSTTDIDVFCERCLENIAAIADSVEDFTTTGADAGTIKCIVRDLRQLSAI